MGFMNRRNAFIGWVAWQVGKRVIRRKAKSAVPTIDRESKRPNVPAIVAALGAIGGALWFWRSRGGDDDSETLG